jgi:hypothetical protein
VTKVLGPNQGGKVTGNNLAGKNVSGSNPTSILSPRSGTTTVKVGNPEGIVNADEDLSEFQFKRTTFGCELSMLLLRDFTPITSFFCPNYVEVVGKINGGER